MTKRAALICALLLCVSALGLAFAQENPACTISAAYHENQQALSVSMSLAYTNPSAEHLQRAAFNLYANCLRRESTLPYDNATLEAAFPYAYAPGGVEFTRVLFNGKPARWFIEGDSECFLWVECALEPGEKGIFSFEYALLLTENRAFLGCGEDVRLNLFYPSPCLWHDGFVLNPPSPAALWLESQPMDFTCELQLPAHYSIAGGFGAKLIKTSAGVSTYRIQTDAVGEISLCLSARFYEREGKTPSSLRLRVLGSDRAKNRQALSEALKAAALYESWFGPLPWPQVDIVFASSALSSAHPGLIVLGGDGQSLSALLAKEYFVCALNVNPNLDPFLSGGVSEYVSLLLEEELNGEAAFTRALTKRLLPALRLTVPGGLTPDSWLSRFNTVYEYELVAVKRGAAVLHEMRKIMGRDAFLKALGIYYSQGRGSICGISQLVSAFDQASGRELGSALISWLYTINEYANYLMDEYD